MKKISLLFLCLGLVVIPNCVNAQLVVSENDLFWARGKIGTNCIGTYRMQITNADEWGLGLNSMLNDVYVGGGKVLSSKDYGPTIGKINIEVLKYKIYFDKKEDFESSKKRHEGEQHIILNELDTCGILYVRVSPVYNNRITETAALLQKKNELLDFLKKNLKVIKVGEKDDVSDSVSSETETDSLPINWKKVIGGAAALTVAVATASALLRRRRLEKEKAEKELEKKTGKNPKPKKKETEKEKEKKKKKNYFYLLQLSKDVVNLRTMEKDTMVITAWRVDEDGNKVIASDALIEISSSEKSLSILPPTGQGQCKATFSLISKPKDKELVLKIKAKADSKEFNATAKVDCGAPLTLFVDAGGVVNENSGQNNCEVKYDKKEGWHFGSLHIWFTENPEVGNQSKPVPPPFSPVFTTAADPPYLIFNMPIDRGDYVWKIPVTKKTDVEFEDKWLFENGKIKITITANKA